LKLDGINKIFSSAGNVESGKQLLSFGLDEGQIFDYRDENFAQKLIEAAGGKFDYCLDTVGGKMSEISAEVLKVKGVYADITFLTTDEAREALFAKAATVLNIANYAFTLDGDAKLLSYYGESLKYLTDKIESGGLSATPIETIGELSAATVAKAHDMLEKNLTRGKKLVMEIN
jgi:NADPH:quinone reductase-like Zn-dependent oxidoreductase